MAAALHREVVFHDFDVVVTTTREAPGWTESHTAMGITLVLVERGDLLIEHGGTESIEPLVPVLFWSGVANRFLGFESPTVCHFAFVPMVRVLSWFGPISVLDRLFGGELVRGQATPADLQWDLDAFRRWPRELAASGPELRKAAELEIEARFRRFVADLAPGHEAASNRPAGSTARGVATATSFIARHFLEPISVDDIATATGWRRDRLMVAFRRLCGLSLWDYVTRVRLAEARRLLADTDLPVLTICHRSGFGSLSRMYAAFQRNGELTPAEYRRAALSAGAPSGWPPPNTS